MGAEVGATTSIFPFDESMVRYLNTTGRKAVSEMAMKVAKDLRADDEVAADPAKYYDRVIEIDLDTLTPYINGPYSPDAAMPIADVAKMVKEKGSPTDLQVALIGSCTNSSYEDITRAASIARQAVEEGITVKTPLLVVPGSTRIFKTLERDGVLDVFKKGERHRARERLRSLHRSVESSNRRPDEGQFDHRILQPQLQGPQRREPENARLPRFS